MDKRWFVARLREELVRRAAVSKRSEDDARDAARTMATESEKKEDGRVVLAANSDDQAAFSDEVKATTTGPATQSGYNPTLLTSVVKVYGKGHDVRLEQQTAAKPATFTSDAEPNLRVLLMPRRLAA